MNSTWVVDRDAGSQAATEVLTEHGFVIIPGALGSRSHGDLYDELSPHFDKAPFSKGLFYGSRTKRFGRVLARSKAAQSLAMNPLVYEPARAVLGSTCQEIQLNLTQAIEISSGSFAQVPHRDQDIWLGAEHPGEMMMNAMWALDDFTSTNGATLVWPGSHLMPDLQVPDTPGFPVEMPRGSVCLFLGSTLHAGGANWSGGRRRGLVMSYCLGWLKPCENPWLSYPPHVARHFSPELAHLIGYRQDAPSLNNVEGCCPSKLLRGELAEQPFSDQLTPEQTALIQQYNEAQVDWQSEAA